MVANYLAFKARHNVSGRRFWLLLNLVRFSTTSQSSFEKTSTWNHVGNLFKFNSVEAGKFTEELTYFVLATFISVALVYAFVGWIIEHWMDIVAHFGLKCIRLWSQAVQNMHAHIQAHDFATTKYSQLSSPLKLSVISQHSLVNFSFCQLKLN